MQPFQRLFAFVSCLFLLISSAFPVNGVAQDDIDVAELLATGGTVRAMATDGERLFVGKGTRLVIYDVAGNDPVLGDKPIELTQTHLHDVVVSLTHAGNYVYLGLKHGDVVVVDVSDEIEPKIVGRVTVRINDEEDKEVEGLAISGMHLYCNLGKDGLQVVDVTNPTNPQVGVNISSSSEWINGIVAVNNRLYSLEQLRNVAPRTLVVRIYSLANPAAPSIEGNVDLKESFGGLRLSVDGDYAYVYGEWYNPGVLIVDVSQPANPVLKGTFSDGEFTPIVSIRGDGNRFYAQSSPGFSGEPTQRLIAVDVSNPASPQKLGEVELTEVQSNYTGGLPMVGDRIFCSFGFGDVAMQTVDVSSPTDPKIGLEFGEPTTFFGQTIIGTTLYRSSADKLFAYDITDPNAPLHLQTYEGEEFSEIQSIEGNETRLFLSRRDGNNMSVVIMDMTDPDNPKERGSYTPADENHKVAWKGDYLYVITVDGDPWSNDVFPWGLDIVDITNPDAPNRVGRIEGTIRDIIAPEEGKHVYILADELPGNLSTHKGLVALDVTNPASPTVASSRQTVGTRGRMTLSGSTVLAVTNSGNVFSAGQFWSLESFDVSNPSAITALERYDGPSGKDELASDVVVSNDGIVTVGLMGIGLRFFEYDELTTRANEKGAIVLDGLTSAGSYGYKGISSFQNYSTNNWNYIVAKEYTWASVFSYPNNRNNYHRGDGGGTSICYQRKDPDHVLLLTSVWPARAAKIGCTVTPSGTQKYAKGATAQLSTAGVVGWNFQRWVGAASGSNPKTSVLMDAHKGAAAVYRPSFGIPTLTVGLNSPQAEMHCPPDPSVNPRIKIASVTLSANSETNWRVTSVTLTGEGSGPQKHVKEVILKYNGKEAKFPVSDRNNDPFSSISFSVHELIPLGTTLTMDVYYAFDISSRVSDGRYMPCPIGSVPDYGVSITSGQITASPDDGTEIFSISPDPSVRFSSEKQLIACVQNVMQKKGYDLIQDALDDRSVSVLDSLSVCPGVYNESVEISFEMALVSVEGFEVTEIVATDNVFAIKIWPSNASIQGFTITGRPGIDGIVGASGYQRNVTIAENYIRFCDSGIYLRGSSDWLIVDNVFSDNINGIALFDTEGHVIQDNVITTLNPSQIPSKTVSGIRLERSPCTIQRNIIELAKGKESIGIQGSETKKGLTIRNTTIRNSQKGIELTSCSKVEVKKLLLQNCDIGFLSSGGSFITVDSSVSKTSEIGFLFTSSYQATVKNSSISRAEDEEKTQNVGVEVDHGENIVLKKNSIANNAFGVQVKNSIQSIRVLENRFHKNRTAYAGSNSYVYFYGNGLYDHGTTVDFNGAEKGNEPTVLSADMNTGSIILDNSTLIAKGNEIVNDSINGLYATNGSIVLLRQNRVEGNGEFGVLSDDPSATTDARFNWWGDPSGPSGEGSGQGDAVSRYVDFEDWASEPISLVVSGGYDTLWVPVGTSDSLSVFYQNWQKRNDQMRIISNDDLGWVSGTGTANVVIPDSLGGEAVHPYSIPENTPDNTVNIFRFNAVSTTNASWTDSDSVVMVAYAPRLARLRLAPDTTKMLPGDSISFVVLAVDQHDQFFETEGFSWTAEGGTIEENGLYRAGNSYGTYNVRVRHSESGLEEVAVVIITDDLSEVAAEEPVAGEAVQRLYSSVLPNPFSSETGIHFVVERRSPVSLEVYDGLGRKVATLISETLLADSYELRWEARDLPSGVYLYRLHVGDQISSGQLILAR